jgi:hypothetical protein
MCQLVIQFRPPLVEKACSQCAVSRVMPDQMNRAFTGVPWWVSSP